MTFDNEATDKAIATLTKGFDAMDAVFEEQKKMINQRRAELAEKAKPLVEELEKIMTEARQLDAQIGAMETAERIEELRRSS